MSGLSFTPGTGTATGLRVLGHVKNRELEGFVGRLGGADQVLPGSRDTSAPVEATVGSIEKPVTEVPR